MPPLRQTRIVPARWVSPRALRRGMRVARLGLLVLVTVAIGLAKPGVAFAAKQQTPAQKETELRKLNDRIEKVRKSVNADVRKRDKLSVELREAELGVAEARRELDDIKAQRLVAEGRLRELEREQSRAQREAHRVVVGA